MDGRGPARHSRGLRGRREAPTRRSVNGVVTVESVGDGSKTITGTFVINRHALAVNTAGSGDRTASTSPLTVPMIRTKSITATFAINTYTLTVTSVGNGSVTISPVQASYDHGTPVMLTASAAAGSHFAGWSGDASGAINPLGFYDDRREVRDGDVRGQFLRVVQRRLRNGPGRLGKLWRAERWRRSHRGMVARRSRRS